MLFPFFRFEKNIDPYTDTYHEKPCRYVAVLPAQFRHIVEIHTPNADEKCQRYEDCRDDRQAFHDRIHA